jgi:diphosphomevalonate decarboxylase
MDTIREIAGVKLRAKISTNNSFPASAGIASSASGFAALTVAAAAALGLQLSEKELSGLARLGSGSACRSVPDGFVKWEGEYARSLYPPDYWDLRDILVIVETTPKKISSSTGHDLVQTSPYYTKRLEQLPERLKRCERALKNKDIVRLGEVIEEDCLDMHHVMQTQNPPLFYWNNETKRVIEELQESGLPAYFTNDAGPNVHVLCESKNEKKVRALFEKEYQVLVNRPSKGARIIHTHLF